MAVRVWTSEAVREVLVRLGQRITARRTWMGLSQGQLASSCGFAGRESLRAYEAGKSDPPASTLLRISTALSTTTTDLLGEGLSPEDERDAHVAMSLMTDPVVVEMLRRMLAMDDKGRAFALAMLRMIDRHGLHKGSVLAVQERLVQSLRVERNGAAHH